MLASRNKRRQVHKCIKYCSLSYIVHGVNVYFDCVFTLRVQILDTPIWNFRKKEHWFYLENETHLYLQEQLQNIPELMRKYLLFGHPNALQVE